MNVIKKEVEAHEASEGTKVKLPQSDTRSGHNLPTANALVTHGHNIQCVYCNGQNYSASCDKVCEVKARKSKQAVASIASNSIIRHESARAPKPAETVIKNTIIPYVMARPSVPNQQKDDSINTTNATTTTAQSKEERKTILLQTVQAIAGTQ